MEFSAFEIYKKEINWKTEESEDSVITTLGAVKSENEAKQILSKLNEMNDRVDVSYTYAQVNLTLFRNVEEFFSYNFNKNIDL